MTRFVHIFAKVGVLKCVRSHAINCFTKWILVEIGNVLTVFSCRQDHTLLLSLPLIFVQFSFLNDHVMEVRTLLPLDKIGILLTIVLTRQSFVRQVYRAYLNWDVYLYARRHISIHLSVGV